LFESLEIKMQNTQPTGRSAVHSETFAPSFSFWSELLAAMRKKARLKHDFEHLHAMSDHELRDIGITRDQIDTALRRGRRGFRPPRI
jgi:uncharacterized protein YjiS (DUF1127 family)